MQRATWVAGVAMWMAAVACGHRDDNAIPEANVTPVPGKLSVAPASADRDVAAHGGSIPRGYVAQLDAADASIADASYREDGTGRWEVRTGPAHIVYALGDTTRKSYAVTATFEQLEAPVHPEAYGIFVGGSSLDDPAKRQYTYVILRGDGKYAIKARNGTSVRTVKDWTAHPAIPTQDASGKALYGLRIDVDGKTAKVSVNGKPVTTFTTKDGPLEGITGVRINHNLHLMVTPVTVTRRLS